MEKHAGKQTVRFSLTDQRRIRCSPPNHVFHIIGSPGDGDKQKYQYVRSNHNEVQHILGLFPHALQKILIGLIIILSVHSILSCGYGAAVHSSVLFLSLYEITGFFASLSMSECPQALCRCQ